MSNKTTPDEEESLGHAAHSKVAEQHALPGTMPRPLKIVFLGAGSGFCSTLLRDLLLIPNQMGGQMHLVDIDESRLQRSVKLIDKIISILGPDKWSVFGTVNREEALPDADYVINSIEVSGKECVKWDNDIPLKYGVDQCIGDTIGPGGLFKALRTGPVWLDILRDIRKLAPHARVLNYTNPMATLCLSAFRAVPEVPVVGLCHSVQGTSHLLASMAELYFEEMEWECAGINHLAWFTKLRHRGENLYPRLKEKFRPEVEGKFSQLEENDPDKKRDTDLVRKDMCLQFGAFITESSGHLSEYLPYYRKRNSIREHYTRPKYDGESRFYASNWPTWREAQDQEREAMIDGSKSIDTERSWEYGSWIIESIEKNAPYVFHGNVYNQDHKGDGQLVTNLPSDGCVEVTCLVNQNGWQPARFGELPPQMAHLCRSNMASFDLAAKAIIEKSKEAAIHSLMLDPLTAAVCAPSEIREMAEELFEAEADFLPGFK